MENFSIALVSEAVICKAEEMAEWIMSECKEFILVTTVSHYSKDLKSSCEFYEKNNLKKKFDLISYRFSMPFADPAFFFLPNLLLHSFSILYAFLRLRRRFDIFLAIGYFNVLIGLMLRQLGVCRYVIYYSGDYFRSCEKWDWKNWYRSLQTKAFQLNDRLDVRFCDAIWNTSTPMQLVRKEKNIFIPEKTPQVIVPLGVKNREVFFKSKRYESFDVVFIGNLQEGQGLQLFLEVLPEVAKEVKSIKLHVIGTGSYEPELKLLIKNKRLDDYVIFHGFIKSEEKLQSIFSKCVMGLATYLPSKESFTCYVTPGKVITYLEWGLPVIMTSVSEVAQKIDGAKAGIVINYKKEEMLEAVLMLLKNRELLNLYGENAKKLAFEYSWGILYEKAFSETLSGWGIKC